MGTVHHLMPRTSGRIDLPVLWLRQNSVGSSTSEMAPEEKPERSPQKSPVKSPSAQQKSSRSHRAKESPSHRGKSPASLTEKRDCHERHLACEQAPSEGGNKIRRSKA